MFFLCDIIIVYHAILLPFTFIMLSSINFLTSCVYYIRIVICPQKYRTGANDALRFNMADFSDIELTEPYIEISVGRLICIGVTS